MEKYICENVFVPLRSAPSHKSEMVSQILFGEKYTITDRAGSWLKIHTMFDNYSGWIDGDHTHFTPDKDNLQGHPLNRSLLCYKNDTTKLVLEAGCEIFNPDFEGKIFTAGNDQYRAAPEFSKSYVTAGNSPAEVAMKFINSPYIWGGRIPSGIDCSGFTQLAYKICNIPLPRDAAGQAAEGKLIEFIDEALPGDLAFFGDEKNKISHVGMILSRGLIVHAWGRVRIDPVDHQGIYNNEIRGYSHIMKTLRRIAV